MKSLFTGSRKFFLGLMMTVFFLVITLLFSYRTSSLLYHNFGWVEHTYLVKEKLNKIVFSLSHMESQLRAFIITSDINHIHNFDRNAEVIREEVRVLKKLVSDNPSQLKKAEQMENLCQERIAFLYQTLQAKKTFLQQEQKLQNYATTGTEMTRRIIKLQMEMEKGENYLLKERQTDSFTSLDHNKLSIIMATGFSFISIILIIFLIDRDIKKRVFTEKLLRELDVNKNKFFSIISHDLRGPIHGIAKLAGFLKDEHLDPEESRDMGRLIENSCLKVGDLLENLLRWSQMQMGKIDYHPVDFYLKELVKTAKSHLELSAEMKDIKIKERGEEFYVRADKDMILTALRNLISNAIKFSHKGGDIEIETLRHTSGKVMVKVIDHGIGMPDEISNNLFKMEKTQSRKGTMNETGTGLGLLICKEFIEKNHGTIGVESKLQQGTSFFFTLPVASL